MKPSRITQQQQQQQQELHGHELPLVIHISRLIYGLCPSGLATRDIHRISSGTPRRRRFNGPIMRSYENAMHLAAIKAEIISRMADRANYARLDTNSA